MVLIEEAITSVVIMAFCASIEVFILMHCRLWVASVIVINVLPVALGRNIYLPKSVLANHGLCPKNTFYNWQIERM